MPVRDRTILLLTAAACMGVPAPAGAYAQPGSSVRVVLDSLGRRHTGRLVSLGTDFVVLRDDLGRNESFPTSSLLALMPQMGALSIAGFDHASGLLRLTDGQVFPGLPGASVGETSAEETLSWGSDALGALQIPIEDVRQVVLRAGVVRAAGASKGAADTVLLVNGDRVEGFIASVGDAWAVEREGRVTTIEASRIAGGWFSNPPEASSGTWVWLTDGTAMSVHSIRVDEEGKAQVAPDLTPEGALQIGADQVRGVSFATQRLQPLARMEFATVPGGGGGGGGGRLGTPVRVGDPASAALFAADIEFPSPMRTSWTMPPNASRLIASAQMPPASRVWGDCELVLSRGGVELLRERMTGSSGVLEINLDLGSGDGPLEITVEPGPDGPILDRVFLRRAMVIVGER